jgi:hypothetical protein
MQMYAPQAQLTDSFLTMVVRSSGDPSSLATEARRAIWSVAGDVPVYVAPLSGSRDAIGRAAAVRDGVAPELFRRGWRC